MIFWIDVKNLNRESIVIIANDSDMFFETTRQNLEFNTCHITQIEITPVLFQLIFRCRYNNRKVYMRNYMSSFKSSTQKVDYLIETRIRFLWINWIINCSFILMQKSKWKPTKNWKKFDILNIYQVSPYFSLL